MDYTSKSLPDDVATRFESLQPESMTVGEFMAECLDAYEDNATDTCDDVASAEDVEQLQRQLESIETQVSNLPTDIVTELR